MSAANVTPFRPRTAEESECERPRREAAWARARSRLTRATKRYDDACRATCRNAINDSGGSLYEAEAALLSAVGLLTVAVDYDRKNSGTMPAEVEEAIGLLSDVHSELRLERQALEDAGVFDETLMREARRG